MAWRTVIGLVRLAAATAGIVALVARFLYGASFRSFVSTDFFGYLTVQSNLAAVGVHLFAGMLALRGQAESRRFTELRAAVTCFLLVAGIVFGILASQAPSQGYRLDVPWSDQVLHFFLPTYALVDWLVFPGRQRVRWRTLLWMLAYPVAWGLVTIVRGQLVGWYPYFFLDPAQAGYPLSFLLYSAGALGLFLAIGVGLTAATRTPPLAEQDLRRPITDHGPGRLARAVLALTPPPRRTARGSTPRR
ncbi:Pr6Pr family membrane protein [Naasia sp. SYSU D00948]|uniref:Pr6Pr family membrane protein n=1 Tax=Naasia sp. SYSU D00948 TaxID=2817379 RepID=UPI001B3070B1|nr:Pr6Pr family membrane protein [Naasia sp. SYSU D00948]